jgi:hypothetical protein
MADLKKEMTGRPATFLPREAARSVATAYGRRAPPPVRRVAPNHLPPSLRDGGGKFWSPSIRFANGGGKVRTSLTALFIALLLAPAAFASAGGADSLLAKSRAAEQSGNRPAALRYAQAAIVADPSRTLPYIALGDLYMKADQSDFAAFYYAEALEIDPQDQTAQAGLALADKATQTSTAAAASSLDKNRGAH